MAPLRALMVALLVLAVLFAGCAASDNGSSKSTTKSATTAGTTTTATSDACPTATANSTVQGWTAHKGRWASVGSAGGRAGVVCGEATEALSALVRDQGEFTDLEASVAFNMLEGDSGAGMVLHYESPQDYNIVRYSPREQGWHIFTVIAGNRQKQDAGSVTPPTTNPEPNQWVELTVTSVDGHVEAWDGNTKVIDYVLPAEASHEGRVGYFLRDAGMAAQFGDFEAKAL